MNPFFVQVQVGKRQAVKGPFVCQEHYEGKASLSKEVIQKIN